MHLNMRLPMVEPLEIHLPTHCPFPERRHPKMKSSGTHVNEYQLNCHKPLRDARCPQVALHYYQCMKCHRIFRVHPPASRLTAYQRS